MDRIPPMVHMYRVEGLTAQQIADRVGLSKATVRNDLALAGVTFRTGWSRRTPRDTEPAGLTDEQRATLRETHRRVGQLLRERRIALGWTQVEVAAKLRIGSFELSRLEYGRRTHHSLLKYLELCAILGVDLTDIVCAAKQLGPAADDGEPGSDPREHQ